MKCGFKLSFLYFKIGVLLCAFVHLWLHVCHIEKVKQLIKSLVEKKLVNCIRIAHRPVVIDKSAFGRSIGVVNKIIRERAPSLTAYFKLKINGINAE